MAKPKLKAEERYEQLVERIYSDEPLDAWTFREVEAEYGNSSSVLNQTIMALAYLAKGQVDIGLNMLRELLPYGDVMFARLYCRFLEKFSQLEQLDSIIYDLADKFPTKWFCYKAGGTAYLLGRLSKCAEYLERHYKMLSFDESREEAVKFAQEAIDDMAAAYESSGCSGEQYYHVGLAVSRVLAEFPAAKSRIEVSGASGGSYIIEIMNVGPEQVCKMNMKLADEICSVDILDDCNLIARFSVERPISKGTEYAYN